MTDTEAWPIVLGGFCWGLWLAKFISGRLAARRQAELRRLADGPSLEERWRELTERVRSA